MCIRINVLLSLAVSLTVFACSSSEQTSDEPETEEPTPGRSLISVTRQQFESSGMELGNLEEREFPQVVKASGYLDVPPQNRAQVSTFMAGYVKSIPLLEGDRVKRGQFLASLENTEYIQIQQDFIEAHEQLTYLESEYERQKTLANENISSQKTFTKAQSDFKTKLAQYDALGKKLRLLNIDTARVLSGTITSSINLYAPIDGYVTNVHASRGMHIGPEDVVMELVNPEHLHVELSVFEKDVMQVKKGQTITFSIPEADDQSYQAEVHLVGRVVEGEERTIKVHGHLKDEDKEGFVPGMFVQAEITVSSDKHLGVPEDAVVSESDNQYLLVKREDRGDTLQFARQKVAVGKKHAQWNAILESGAVDSADQILVKGAFDIAGGSIE
uniref:Efflux RND transporter periplasmic adaptor subunit n=1 Tax=Roseihalotalea indica TaxID=2867963 RepID=A0AA49JIG4_9BACT|nr:efflux RND transporter periplasmic adaptor subunit [Tunicatimonas sp. TK19036]